MKSLIFNSGSSSIKFKLVEIENENILFEGQFKNHDEDFVFEVGGTQFNIDKLDYENSFQYLSNYLYQKNIIVSLDEISLFIHRIVHGGAEFTEPVELSDENIARISKYNEFAPIHNPPALKVVNQIKKFLPLSRQFGVFDTSFHLTNDRERFLYGLPFGYFENLGIRRFGFHGTSYEYVSKEYEKFSKSDLKSTNIIVCHLGSGSSVCAIKNGKSFDHSFGFTPTENLVMSTRSGDVDHAAIIFLQRKLNLSPDDIENLMNKESGLLGISGYSKDMKTLVADYKLRERARLAIDMYVDRIVDYIAQFYVAMNGANAVVFTAGIGQGSSEIREMICNKLEILGVSLDKIENKAENVAKNLKISAKNSKIDLYVIPTNEELQMLRKIKSSL